MPFAKVASRRRAVDEVAPVGVEDPERAVALKKHEEGITKSQDKGKRAKDAVNPPEILKLDREYFQLKSNRKLDPKVRSKRMREIEAKLKAKGYFYDDSREYVRKTGDTELPTAIKTSNLVPMPSGENNEVSYATRRAKDATTASDLTIAGYHAKLVAEGKSESAIRTSLLNSSFSPTKVKAFLDKAKATDMKATLPLQQSGSEPADHMLRANQYEVAGDRARALDSYRAAASGYRRANDRANEAKARDGVEACQAKFSTQYDHPGVGRTKVCDSAEVALRTAVERTRSGESVRITDGNTVRPGRAKDTAPIPTGDSKEVKPV